MKYYISFILYIFISLSNSGTTFAQNVGFEYIKENLLHGEEGVDYWAYVYNEKVTYKDTITLLKRKIVSPYKKSLLFFIDDSPFSDWSHPCRYIFLNQKNLEYTIIEDKFPPIDINNYILLTNTNLSQPQKYDFSKFRNNESSQFKSAISQRSADFGYKYAVIISGGYHYSINNERYWNHCEAIYNALRYYYDFDEAQIFVLMSDGFETNRDRLLVTGKYDDSPTDLDGNGTVDVTNKANRTAVSCLFDMLGEWMLPNDFLYVFVTDHGDRESGSDVNILLWDEEEMRDDEFAAELNKVKAGKSVITMTQCHSGGFIDDLAATNRVITTSCREDESAYARSDLMYSEFVYHWTAGVFGEYPDGEDADADANSDGFVSMEEAYIYAEANDEYAHGENILEHPQYYSNPPTFGEQFTLFGFEINSNIENTTINSGEDKYYYSYNLNVGSNDNDFIILDGGFAHLIAGNTMLLGSSFQTELGAELICEIDPFSIPLLKSANSNVIDSDFSMEEMASSEIINKEHDGSDLILYPNPGKGIYYFVNPNITETQISVFDINGKTIINDNIYTSNRWIIDITEQPSGVYFIRISNKNQVLTRKLIKE